METHYFLHVCVLLQYLQLQKLECQPEILNYTFWNYIQESEKHLEFVDRGGVGWRGEEVMLAKLVITIEAKIIVAETVVAPLPLVAT